MFAASLGVGINERMFSIKRAVVLLRQLRRIVLVGLRRGYLESGSERVRDAIIAMHP
jgi:hypothetical protein